MSLVPLPETLPPFLGPYLPTASESLPFVTLTWAQSLDGRIAAAKGVQTKISHQETKAMTHYLRSKHDAILVGIGTVLADDPKLNCRIPNAASPRPIIIDPNGKWNYAKSTLRSLVESGHGRSPYIIIGENVKPCEEDISILSAQNGKHIALPLSDNISANWHLILQAMTAEKIKSVMIEGGGKIINDLLLLPQFINSIIITIGPVFLGQNGVEVSPFQQVQLENVKWWIGVQDSILAATLG